MIVLGVLPLAYFLFREYPHLKVDRIKEGESVWDRLAMKLQIQQGALMAGLKDPQESVAGSRTESASWFSSGSRWHR